MKNTLLVAGLAMVALFGFGCGPTAYSCDVGSGTSRICYDYTTTAAGYDQATTAGACTLLSGTSGTVCNKAGSTGGCRETTKTSWYFFATVDEAKAACATVTGATFVTP